MTYDWTKVRRETLENLAHAMLSNSLENGAFEYHTAGNDAYNAAVAALRNAVAEARPPEPLRTRSEVDADIAEAVRKGFAAGAKFGSGTGGMSHHYACRLCELVNERTVG